MATRTARRFSSARAIIRCSSPSLAAFFAIALASTITRRGKHARPASADSTLEWKRAVLDRDAGCISPHVCEGALQAHHVVTQQHLRKRHLDEHMWDRRLGVTVCELAHRRHHSARERIPYDSLPAEVAAFVLELVGPDYLVRYYPGAPEPDMQADLAVGRARLRSLERKGGYVR